MDHKFCFDEIFLVFEKIYEEYNKREYVHPDPLEFLYGYESLLDREIAGFIASSLAYGRVQQILKSVSRILEPMGASPFNYVMNAQMEDLKSIYGGFKHRFTTGDEICHLLIGIRGLLEEFGSIENCLCYNMDETGNIISSLNSVVSCIANKSGLDRSSLLSRPILGSACKRHFLFLKWMTRKDEVDPGGWEKIRPEQLIMPVDTHIYSIAISFGMTERKQADLKAAIEITEAFKKIVPYDPTRYDFVLTRFGIRSEMKKSDLFQRCSIPGW